MKRIFRLKYPPLPFSGRHAGEDKNDCGLRVVFRYFHTGIPVILILLSGILPALAQSGGFSGSFTRMGFGARGMGMGNAISTVPSQGVFAHYNPALASYSSGNQIDLSTALMDFDRSLHSINAAFALPPHAGLNVGMLNANVYNIDGRSNSGYHTEYLSTHEFQLFAAFGIAPSEAIRVGIAVKLHLASFHEQISHATGAGFDLGILLEPIAGWKLGFAAQDMVSKYSWNTTDLYGAQAGSSRNDPFPVRLKWGSSYDLKGWNLVLSSEFEILRQQSETYFEQMQAAAVPPRNITHAREVESSSRLMRWGAAWSPHERLALRAGWEITDMDFIAETQRISAGFSVHLPYDALKPSLDYAFVRESLGISGIHVLAIRIQR